MRILALAVAVAFAVGACSDGDGGEPAETTTAGAPADKLSSDMAIAEREVGQVLDQLDDSGCTGEGVEQPVCTTILDTSSVVAETVLIQLDAASDAPADVRVLIADTRDAAQAVVNADKQERRAAVEALHQQLGEWPE